MSSEEGQIASYYVGHRVYLENTDTFAAEEWKYFDFGYEHKLCQMHGKNKDSSGYCRGISMWDPHCFPKKLVDSRNNQKVKCKKLLSMNLLPTEFHVVAERNYSALIAGNNITFTHYLLTPSGQFPKHVVDAALRKLNAEDCQIEAGACPHNLNLIDFENCEIAVGSKFAAQCALKCFAEDEENFVNDRCDAVVLFAWLGSLEATIDELVNLSPWASELILESMEKYKPARNDSNFLMSFGDAIDSLKYQLEQYYVEFPAHAVVPSYSKL
jgi:hypothetical protein